MKAIGYIRVSSAGQADDGISLEAQRARIEAWALAHDYDLVGVEVDAGQSGKRADNRDGLQAAIKAACDNKAALVVYSLSRLSRSVKDTMMIAENLDKAGADLVSLSERIDTTTAAGKMVFRMLAVMAEFERDLVSERTKAALSHLKTQGKRISGKIPYGFDLDTDGKSLNVNGTEQETISRMVKLRKDGLSLQKICDALDADGIKSKMGKKWTHKVVRHILARQIA